MFLSLIVNSIINFAVRRRISRTRREAISFLSVHGQLAISYRNVANLRVPLKRITIITRCVYIKAKVVAGYPSESRVIIKLDFAPL